MNFNLLTAEDFAVILQKVEAIETKVDTLSVDSSRIYTINEACEFFNVSKRTLQKYRDEGMISFSQVGDKIFFQRSDIDAFLSCYRVEAFAQKGGSYVS